MPRLVYRLQLFIFVTVLTVTPSAAQNIPEVTQTDGLPNPNPTAIKGWGELPNGRTWRSTAGIDIGPDGHIWTYERCSASDPPHTCNDATVDPILKLHSETGTVITSFGAGQFIYPDGIHVDDEGNVWITESIENDEETKGHQVIKFSPSGQVLLRLGKPGVAGQNEGLLNKPRDVVTAANGNIFVADENNVQNGGSDSSRTGRIVKFDPHGDFLMAWQEFGKDLVQFQNPHAVAMDSRGRLFVADRGNNRIQIFDQDGNHLDSYVQFGRVNGLFITRDDMLYTIGSESNPGPQSDSPAGIRIGSVSADRVTAFIPPQVTDQPHGTTGEGVAVDFDGNVYSAEEPISEGTATGGLTKFLR